MPAHASYIIGDQTTGTAAVVDPQRDTDQYISFAAEHSLKIKHVFLTHLHADFIAGHLELRDGVGATVYLGAAAKAAYAFTPLRDGDILEFGRVRLKALETLGHTPESISRGREIAYCFLRRRKQEGTWEQCSAGNDLAAC